MLNEKLFKDRSFLVESLKSIPDSDLLFAEPDIFLD